MMLLKPATALVAIALAACSTSGPPAAEASAGQVCTKEPSIGSNRLVTKCRTAEEIAADRAAAEQTGPAINRSRANPVSGSGG
jgi:hypothetical protein